MKPLPSSADLRTWSDDHLIAVLLIGRRPHNPVMVGELLRRPLVSHRFGVLERSPLGHEPWRLN